MDSYETCVGIRANPVTAHNPVVFLNALSRSAGMTKAVESGGIDYITKQFDPNLLRARVDRQLDA